LCQYASPILALKMRKNHEKDRWHRPT